MMIKQLFIRYADTIFFSAFFAVLFGPIYYTGLKEWNLQHKTNELEYKKKELEYKKFELELELKLESKKQ